MIKFEKTNVHGFEATIRGMRNSWNSWENSDSYWGYDCTECGIVDKEGHCVPREHNCLPYLGYEIGPGDLQLMQKLIKAGTDHSKFMRMIDVTVDITAPLYWWKEFSTYKVGTVANSCSTMHCIADKEFELDDFSLEHLYSPYYNEDLGSYELFNIIIKTLNGYRERYLDTKNKDDWWQIIQMLPSSYNQKRTVHLNYQVLRNIYFARRNHRLNEWVDFCKWVKSLPYGKELICIE